jgi:uncharacterized protein YjiS (DUF1127 family)
MRADALPIPRSKLSPDETATARAWARLGRLARGTGRRLLSALSSPRIDLNAFSDAQLRDIGLSRIDVEQPGSTMDSIVRRWP